MTEVERTRTQWASATPYVGKSACIWKLLICAHSARGEADPLVVDYLEPTTDSDSPDSLIDVLDTHGYVMSGPWEPSLDGFVAWVEPDIDAVVRSILSSQTQEETPT